jgi:hypothetical protein
LNRLGIRTEAPPDLQEDVRLARKGDALGAAAWRRILNPHLGRGLLLRLDGGGEPVEAFVRDVDHAHAIRAASRGQGVEERRLAGPLRADDGNVYRHRLTEFLVQLEGLVQDPHAPIDLRAGDQASDADL